MILLTKITKHHFIQWLLKKHRQLDFRGLPKVCQNALICEFFAEKGIYTGLENRMNHYWLESDDSYGYGKRNYFFYDTIYGIDRLIKICNLLYNKKYFLKKS